MAIVDSQSVKSGLPQSRKGIDGNKRIKGVKRHIAADSDGLPLGEVVTTANVHDSKAAYPLIGGLCAQHPHIKTIKADNGYRSSLTEVAQTTLSVDLQCVNSNFGTSEFIPSEGRRGGGERTIARLDSFRRLCRDYKRLLPTTTEMAKMAFMMILLKHI